MAVQDSADLYGLPVEEFTEARNELADRLRDAGDLDEARRVRALKKPSIAAWAVNQLARTNPDDIEELFRLRDDVETASSATELRTRTEKRRDLLTKLVAEARRLLVEAGHASASSTIEKVSRTLLAAGGDDREALSIGTLTHELVANTSTFGRFGSFDAATVVFEDEPGLDPRTERLMAEAAEAEQEAAELDQLAAEAEKAAERIRDRADEARRRATKARERAGKAAGGQA